MLARRPLDLVGRSRDRLRRPIHGPAGKHAKSDLMAGLRSRVYASRLALERLVRQMRLLRRSPDASSSVSSVRELLQSAQRPSRQSARRWRSRTFRPSLASSVLPLVVHNPTEPSSGVHRSAIHRTISASIRRLQACEPSADIFRASTFGTNISAGCHSWLLSASLRSPWRLLCPRRPDCRCLLAGH